MVHGDYPYWFPCRPKYRNFSGCSPRVHSSWQPGKTHFSDSLGPSEAKNWAYQVLRSSRDGSHGPSFYELLQQQFLYVVLVVAAMGGGVETVAVQKHLQPHRHVQNRQKASADLVRIYHTQQHRYTAKDQRRSFPDKVQREVLPRCPLA